MNVAPRFSALVQHPNPVSFFDTRTGRCCKLKTRHALITFLSSVQ
jgi:hypothetical protein